MNHKNQYYQAELTGRMLALLTFIACCLLSFVNLRGQTTEAIKEARNYVEANYQDWGLQAADIAEITVTDAYYDEEMKLTHVYLQQLHRGIALEGGAMGLHLDPRDEVAHHSGRFFAKIDGRLWGTNPAISPEQALRSAAASLGLSIVGNIRVRSTESGPDRKTLLSDAGISLRDIPARLSYVPDEEGHLRLAWDLEIYQVGAHHYWKVRIDAGEGKVLRTDDWVISCNFDHAEGTATAGQRAEPAVPLAADHFASLQTLAAGNFYRVYDQPVETPSHGSRSLVFTGGDPLASPYGWHYDGTVAYNITRGNNVYAYEDQLGVNAGAPAVGGLNPNDQLSFDFPLDLSEEPNAYVDAAVTNLFYWNNLIHDIFYHYGFTEPAGNFQTDNLGKGGNGGDAVMAEAQDGGGTNNANFLTLPDGAPGRMQMYLWTTSQPADLVHIDASVTYPNGGVSFQGIEAAFGPGVDQTGVSGELVIVESSPLSAAGTSSEGCGTAQGAGLPPSNDVTGKIVVIDRGNCTFIEKVMGAQLGGAAGVIVANNQPGAGAISMGGDETGAAIVIPAVMVSYEDGLELKNQIALGPITVSLQRFETTPPLRDGDLDNGIIAHEYGHGISTRLTGGPGTSCLTNSEQQGEGWSDYFALLLTFLPQQVSAGGAPGRGIGTYVLSEPTSGGGIRPAQYSTDLNVNDYTYDDIDNPEISAPHGVGFVWCTMLYDMTWNLIDEYGYDADIVNGSGGNNIALQLVVDGLKLQPCTPTFVEARDAILAADQIRYGGANQCLIWKAFAKRGLGFSAVAGTPERGDEVEAFDLPPICLPNVSMVKTVDKNQAPDGDLLTYTLTITNNGAVPATQVRITDPLPAGTSYVSGSASNNGSLNGGQVRWPKFVLHPGQTATRTFQAQINTGEGTTLVFSDDMEDGVNNWNASLGLNRWQLLTSDNHSGQFAWFAADPDNASNQTLTLTSALPLPAGSQLRFWHRYDTEAGFDGGVVELSNDGGLTWYDLGTQMNQNGYTDFIPLANNPLINGFAFGGSSNGWIQTTADLSQFGGQTVLIRFRFSSDVATAGTGWWVDDVDVVVDPVTVDNTAFFTAAQGLAGEASTSTLVLMGGGTNDTDLNENSFQLAAASTFMERSLTARAYPNPANDQINVALEGVRAGQVSLHVLTAQGLVLVNQNWTVDDDTRVVQLNSRNWPAGIYFLRLQNEGEVKTLRVSINH